MIDELTVRFRFKRPNRELPLTVGGLPVFSRAWGQGKPFDQVVTDIPIGSGPYKIGPVQFGKDITYVRDPQYWARDLNVRKGTANFDRILVKIYKDNTARLEALKAGEFDLMRFFSAGDWARRVTGKKFDTGELVTKDCDAPRGEASSTFSVLDPETLESVVPELEIPEGSIARLASDGKSARFTAQAAKVNGASIGSLTATAAMDAGARD